MPFDVKNPSPPLPIYALVGVGAISFFLSLKERAGVRVKHD